MAELGQIQPLTYNNKIIKIMDRLDTTLHVLYYPARTKHTQN